MRNVPDMPLRIVVLGYVVRGPLAGQTLHHLQYVRGLLDLGHDVYFVEDSDDYDSCYEPIGHTLTRDPSYGLAYAERVFTRAGLGSRWGYFDAHTAMWHGPDAEHAEGWCRSADVVLNISGVNPLRSWCEAAPVRVLIDTDPAFVQIRHLHDAAARERAEQHTHFRSFGENIGSSSSVPDDGFEWRPTRQPVVLDLWLTSTPPTGAAFTTVMQWNSYPPVRHGDVEYGMKSTSFPLIEDLPSSTSLRLQVAATGPSTPFDRLRAHGWEVRDPLEISLDPLDYQRYMTDSLAELTIAKHGYVVGNTGWFSERSAGYMASGRAVVTQDTGFTTWMPTGTGVVAFTDHDSALEAVERVARDPVAHGLAARRLAEGLFDSRVVLTRLLTEL